MDYKPELFETYLDESEDTASGLYVVGGFIAKVDVWRKFEPKWLASLPAGIPFFHATDCFSGNEEFETLSKVDRATLLDRLTDLIVMHEVWLVSYAVDVKTYKQIAPKPKRNEFLVNKYAAAFSGVVELACTAMGDVPRPTDRDTLTNGDHWEKCAFIIESSEYDASASDTIAGMRIDPVLWFRNRIGAATYRTKSGPGAVPLLQVADLGAFLATKHRANAIEGSISWKPYYEKLKKAGRVCPTVLADEYSLKKLSELHTELKKERAAGRNYWDDLDH